MIPQPVLLQLALGVLGVLLPQLLLLLRRLLLLRALPLSLLEVWQHRLTLLQASNGLQGLLLFQGNGRGHSGWRLLHGLGGRGVQGMMLLRLQVLQRWSCGRSWPRGSGRHLMLQRLVLLLGVLHRLVLLQMLLLLKHLLVSPGR